MCAHREEWSRGVTNCHSYTGVRVPVDPKDQKDCAESLVTLMVIRVHKQRLERHSVARRVQGNANGIMDSGLASCERRAGSKARVQPICAKGFQYLMAFLPSEEASKVSPEMGSPKTDS